MEGDRGMEVADQEEHLVAEGSVPKSDSETVADHTYGRPTSTTTDDAQPSIHSSLQTDLAVSCSSHS